MFRVMQETLETERFEASMRKCFQLVGLAPLNDGSYAVYSATKKGALAYVFPQVAHNDEAVSVGEIVSEVAITSRPQKDPAAVGPAGGESSSDGGSQDGDEQSESGDDDE